jgi:hypothetical protein
MKPHLLTLCAALLFAATSSAQSVLDYAFSSETQGFYGSLSNDVMVFSESFDDVVSPPIEIPAFSMGGQTSSTLFIYSNGFISLGTTTGVVNYSPLTTNTNVSIISPFGTDLQSVDASSRISYSVDSAGIHVQWENVRRYNVPGESFSFQAHLLPSDSLITFVYGGMNNIATLTTYAQVGLRVGFGFWPDEIACRSVNDNGFWFPSQAGSTNAFTCAFDNDTQPFSGLTYAWENIPNMIGGCTDVTACNFNSFAMYNDGTCEYCSCQVCGCADSLACNFDANATYNVACSYNCFGCTDATATNFNPNATFNDGSCFYAGLGETCGDPIVIECGIQYTGNTNNVSNDNDVSGVISCQSTIGTAGQYWYVLSVPSIQTIQVSTMSALTDFDTKLHVFSSNSINACGMMNCIGSNDDFGSTLQSQMTFVASPGLFYFIRVGGYLALSGNYELSIDGLCALGCTDSTACNYNSAALADDGSCDYCSCNPACGCTNVNACNYDPQATIDDGSCANSLLVYISSDTTVCFGETVWLWSYASANNASYQWTANGVVISTWSEASATPASTTMYELTVTDANGCTGTDMVVVSVFPCVAGCMDATACNFDPQATSPMNCDYSCLGCTDATALNFDADATVDNGACYYVGEGTTCGNPIALSCAEGWYTGVTVGVVNDNTTSGSNVCGNVSTSGQRWYVYEATFSTTVTISTINSLTNYDTYLKVFTGSCGNLSCVAFNDDVPGTNFQSQVEFTAQAGVTYFIRVGGFASQQGTFGLTFECGGGCLDPQACNYQAQAPFEDGSCTYGADCFGCTDSNASNYQPQAVYNEGCEYTTNITVYHDTNGDGVQQNNEPGMSNWSVYIPALNATVFTNNSGVASLNVTPNTYSIELINNSTTWVSSSPTAVTIDIPAITNASFGVIPATGEAFYAAGPYDGFWDIIHCDDGYEAGVFLNNLGTVDLSGTLTLTCDPLFTPEQDTYSSIAPDQVAAGFAQWNINAFAAGSNGIFSFHIDGPGPVNIGSTYNFQFHLVLNDAQGNVIYDNTWTTSPFIACAYDPNDLTATPVGYEAPHFVLAGDRMQYRVRFQNTGNLPAEDVRIVGALDPTKFDLSTFAPLYGSAPFVTCLLNNGTIDFTFNDIYLPDATNNEPESHGFVVYEVRLLPGVDPSEVVLNEASIYFDSNPAIVTNETYHTIFDCTSFTPMTGTTSVCEGEAITLTANQPYVEAFAWTIDGVAGSDNSSSFQNILAPGTHTVTLNTANPLCSEDHTATVLVHGTPELNMPADTAFCLYSIIELSAIGNGNIVWTNGIENNGLYEIYGSQTLNATLTSPEGCVAQGDWNIEALPIPSIAYTVDGLQLTALDGDAWQWYLNGTPIEGATSSSYTMSAGGAYSVEVTSMGGCSAMSGVTNYIVGVVEADAIGIRVYPNPMENELRIDLPSQGTYHIELRDLTGRLIATRSQCQGTCTLQREGAASGMYELLIKGEGVYAHQRVVLK